jgi:hypothetical protein
LAEVLTISRNMKYVFPSLVNVLLLLVYAVAKRSGRLIHCDREILCSSSNSSNSSDSNSNNSSNSNCNNNSSSRHLANAIVTVILVVSPPHSSSSSEIAVLLSAARLLHQLGVSPRKQLLARHHIKRQIWARAVQNA